MNTSQSSDRVIVFALLGVGATLERRLDRSLSNIKGISFSEFQLLDALARSQGATSTRVDLAAAIAMTPSGVTRALKPLERLGFVETIRDGRDARRSLATLTDEGHELVADANGVVDDVVSSYDALVKLDNQSRANLLDILRSLAI